MQVPLDDGFQNCGLSGYASIDEQLVNSGRRSSKIPLYRGFIVIRNERSLQETGRGIVCYFQVRDLKLMRN